MIVPDNLDDAPKPARGRRPPSVKRSMANDADDEGEVSLCHLITIHTSDIAMQDAPNPKRGRPPPLEGEVSSSLSNVFNASDTCSPSSHRASGARRTACAVSSASAPLPARPSGLVIFATS